MKEKTSYLIAALYAATLIIGITLLFVKPGAQKTEHFSLKNTAQMFSRDAVGYVEIYGPIYIKDKSSGFGFTRDADAIVRQLRRFSETKEIKAVVLRINSPGGSVAAVQEICDEVKLLKEKKKIVVASMGDVAASGGYYIASQCDKIVADKGTLTGSIGVILQLSNIEGLFKKIGVSMKSVQSGKYKDIGSPFRELTLEERQILQNISDTVYNQFVDAITEGRKLDRKKVLEFADGRIFVATQAKDLGLIDSFGNSEAAIALASELAKIPGKPKVIRDSDAWSFFSSIVGQPTEELKTISKALGQKKVRLDYMME